ncbi:grasp-with-spasm system ATP-grasp peptide maturase [Flavobacterium sp. TP390]|uniref:Grasp-with-spasm system ATP-grasp peptide maturase n=2 Tax=Flavobacterium profundi TaxID=1774945 RepID=A0A6I4IRR2_9FLAO|nr:grasp-with-spasm system ATP-grasp peptide maturase [Flavobacterium profundi]
MFNYLKIMEKNKLILICSDENEPSTDIVCSWLNYHNKKFLRISEKNLITIKKIIIENKNVDIIFDIDDFEYKLSELKSYWYRRSQLKFQNPNFIKILNKTEQALDEKINVFLNKEFHKTIEFFEYELNKLAVLNKFDDNYINKLKVLSIAKDLGIKISNTYIVNDFDSIDFKDSYITKAISDLVIFHENTNYYSMTQRVSFEDGENINNTLIQKEVKKKFEIRSFFFANTFYSSAIFSQENEKTSLDFRNYDFENPNRVVPYKLPIGLETKLKELCNLIDLKSGSLDLVYTTENEYLLFEINPVGQFEQVSFPCNYNLHKKIAEIL